MSGLKKTGQFISPLPSHSDAGVPEAAPSHSPFANESWANIKQTLEEMRPNDYLKIGLGIGLGTLALAASVKHLPPELLQSVKGALRMNEPTLSELPDIAGSASTGSSGLDHRSQLLAQARVGLEQAAREGSITIGELRQRSAMHEILGNMELANLDLVTAAKLMARKQYPELDTNRAWNLVESLKVYPADGDTLIHLDKIAGIQSNLIARSRDLESMPDSIEKAVALSERASYYKDLGHFQPALNDLNESIAMSGDQAHVPLYQRGALHAHFGYENQANDDLVESGKMAGRLAALKHGIPASDAAEFVDEARAYPTNAQMALRHGQESLYKTIASVIKVSRELQDAAFTSGRKRSTLRKSRALRAAWALPGVGDRRTRR